MSVELFGGGACARVPPKHTQAQRAPRTHAGTRTASAAHPASPYRSRALPIASSRVQLLLDLREALALGLRHVGVDVGRPQQRRHREAGVHGGEAERVHPRHEVLADRDVADPVRDHRGGDCVAWGVQRCADGVWMVCGGARCGQGGAVLAVLCFFCLLCWKRSDDPLRCGCSWIAPSAHSPRTRASFSSGTISPLTGPAPMAKLRM